MKADSFKLPDGRLARVTDDGENVVITYPSALNPSVDAAVLEDEIFSKTPDSRQNAHEMMERLLDGLRRRRDAIGEKLRKMSNDELPAVSGTPPTNQPQNASYRFDPMQATVGSLVGTKLGQSQATVNASPTSDTHSRWQERSEQPAPDIGAGRRRFDPTQPTIGSLVGLPLVHGHTSGKCVNTEPDDMRITMHPGQMRG